MKLRMELALPPKEKSLMTRLQGETPLVSLVPSVFGAALAGMGMKPTLLLQGKCSRD